MDNNTLSLYHIFKITAECQSISEAANILYISQPAVSKSIKKLEDTLDTKLFNRNSRGITLTEEGRYLYSYVKNAFDSISLGEFNLKRINTLGIGHIKIGVSSTLCKHMLLPYLKSFAINHPHVQISIEIQPTIPTLKLIENREIDFGLIAKPDYIKGLILTDIGTITDTFAATPAYLNSLMERENIALPEIFSYANLMLLDKENLSRRYVDKYLNYHKLDTEKALIVNSMDLLIEFAKTGLGVGCVIKEFIKDELDDKTLVEIPLSTPIPSRTVCLAYLDNVPLSTAGKLFVNHIINSITS